MGSPFHTVTRWQHCKEVKGQAVPFGSPGGSKTFELQCGLFGYLDVSQVSPIMFFDFLWMSDVALWVSHVKPGKTLTIIFELFEVRERVYLVPLRLRGGVTKIDYFYPVWMCVKVLLSFDLIQETEFDLIIRDGTEER